MTEGRIYNFSAGPSILPESVLKKAQEDFMNYNGSGMSVLEMSHRSKVYDEIIVSAESNLREVMSIPDNYKVLFLHGGATGMFAALAMNLGSPEGTADYIISGNFSGNAYKEAKKYIANVRVAGTTESENFKRIPRQDELDLSQDADYVHICQNNTIFGTTWKYLPDTAGVPIVADMSSCILSEPVDVTKYGMIYAGVQKNMAPSGVAVVIVREDLLGKAQPITPDIWNFEIESKKASMLNTPPTYPIYFIKLVTEWIRDEMGGLDGMKKININKAGLLYDYLDDQEFYSVAADPADRSMMNVVFRTPNEELDAKFVKESVAAGFSNLKGHRLVGGLRASIYNAMPTEGVEALVTFMKEFAGENS